MQTILQDLEQFWKQVRQYLDTRIAIFKLKSIDVIAGIVSQMLVLIMLFVGVLFFITLVSIAAALWLNHSLMSSFAGFLLVGFFYGCICLLLFALRKRLFRIILTRYILRKMMKLHEPTLPN